MPQAHDFQSSPRPLCAGLHTATSPDHLCSDVALTGGGTERMTDTGYGEPLPSPLERDPVWELIDQFFVAPGPEDYSHYRFSQPSPIGSHRWSDDDLWADSIMDDDRWTEADDLRIESLNHQEEVDPHDLYDDGFDDDEPLYEVPYPFDPDYDDYAIIEAMLNDEADRSLPAYGSVGRDKSSPYCEQNYGRTRRAFRGCRSDNNKRNQADKGKTLRDHRNADTVFLGSKRPKLQFYIAHRKGRIDNSANAPHPKSRWEQAEVEERGWLSSDHWNDAPDGDAIYSEFEEYAGLEELDMDLECYYDPYEGTIYDERSHDYVGLNPRDRRWFESAIQFDIRYAFEPYLDQYLLGTMMRWQRKDYWQRVYAEYREGLPPG